MESKRAFVLLHGAGLAGWIWDQVTGNLKLPHLAIDLPGRSGSFDFSEMRMKDIVKIVLEQIEESGAKKTILVAHSVTGPLALALYTARPEAIESIVFIGAAIPHSGQSYADCLPFVPRFFLKLFAKIYPQGLKPPAKIAQKALCNDMEDQAGKNIVDRMVGEAPCLFLDRVSWILPDKAVYIRLLQDRTDLSPELQLKMAAMIQNCRVINLNSGHLPMLSQPIAIADALNSVV